MSPVSKEALLDGAAADPSVSDTAGTFKEKPNRHLRDLGDVPQAVAVRASGIPWNSHNRQ
jgi:hypothetical protein